MNAWQARPISYIALIVTVIQSVPSKKLTFIKGKTAKEARTALGTIDIKIQKNIRKIQIEKSLPASSPAWAVSEYHTH